MIYADMEAMIARRKAAASYWHHHQPYVSYREVCKIFNVESFDVYEWRLPRRVRFDAWLDRHTADVCYLLVCLTLVSGILLSWLIWA
jgi:hypothetical protein